jgi:hypothetical protein
MLLRSMAKFKRKRREIGLSNKKSVSCHTDVTRGNLTEAGIVLGQSDFMASLV